MASRAGDNDWQIVREEEADSLTLSLEGEKEPTHRSVERQNLIGIVNLVVKGLIETSMRQGKTLNDEHPQLQQCLIAMEHVMRHRLKTKRTMLGQKKSFWGVVESFEKSSTDFCESVLSVRGLPGVRTAVGRGRAWLRFSFMQKKLAEHIRIMVENRHKLSEWYESDSLLLSEEGQVLAGLLMGLNTIDYNMLMRAEDFDRSVGPLDLSQFLRDGNYGVVQQIQPSEEEIESELSQLLDQKAYLEELNSKLESSVERLQAKLAMAESTSSSLKEKVREQQEEVGRLHVERDGLREMTEKSSAELRKALENLQDDQRAELQTHVQTKSGLNDLYASTQRNLDTESKRRDQVEQELDILKGARAEKEMAMQLLEKNVHEKQDNIVGLRKQLQEMKSANMKMSSQIKTGQDTHQKDSVKIRTLENKLSQTTANLKQKEKELLEIRSALSISERTSRELGGRLQEVQLARSSAEQDLAIEKQWRASLQMEIQREKDRVVELTNDAKKMKSLKKEHTELQEKYVCLQETISEQEIALVEMGRQLSLSKEKLSDMKEVSTIMKESVWVDDRNISDCQHCSTTFSVARRKHHCRNCGGVFCNSCSENSLQLASSSKPVRVCDACYSMLLERSSS